ncbi:MAG: helix-turn-helix domain-containing protein [Actinomycetota bacterium]|nr:helix-turn-helix domain-containing protein [Actinomycetota bacterium]
MSEYLKLPEVAQRLGVSEKTARRYVKQGTLPSVFVGGAYRVTPEDVAAFLEDARVLSKKDPAPPSLEPTFNDVLEEERRLTELGRWIEYIGRRARAREQQAQLEENPFLADWKAAIQWDSEVSGEAFDLLEAAEEAARTLMEGGAARGASAEELQKLEDAYRRLRGVSQKVTALANEVVIEAGRETLDKAAEAREKEFEAIQQWLGSIRVTQH